MTLETEIGCFAVWHSSERIPIDDPFLALPIEIMTGKAGDLAVFQGKIIGYLCLLFVRGHNVRWMNIAVWGLQMTLAQEIVITIVFQILLSTPFRSLLVTFCAVLAGIVEFRGPNHLLGCTQDVSFLPLWLCGDRLLCGWRMYSGNLVFGLRPDVWFPLCAFSAKATQKKRQ